VADPEAGIPDLDRTIHQRTRLRILALLHRNRPARFAWVRKALDLTAGNLGSHVETLEEESYVERDRVLTADGFEVRLRITPEGADAFGDYVASLEEVLEGADAPPAPEATAAEP
jgi:DNA-binding MarR family transcriptional regulator